jgi:hypothetical protein
MRMEINELEKEIAKDNTEIKDTKAKEKIAKKEENNTNKINVEDKVNNLINSRNDNNLNKP